MRERHKRPPSLRTARVEALVSRPKGLRMIRTVAKPSMSRALLGSPGEVTITSAQASRETQ